MIVFLKYSIENPFNHNNIKKNFQEIFGVEKRWIRYILPLVPSERISSADSIKTEVWMKEIISHQTNTA